MGGVNRIADFKISKHSDKFELKCKNWEFWENNTIDISYGLMRVSFN